MNMTTNQQYLDEAIAIADRIASEAVYYRGSANWVHRRFALASTTQPDSHPSLTTLKPIVYDGTPGVALVLARVSRFSGEREHKRAARGAIEHALRAVRGDAADLVGLGSKNRFGFYSGLLGVAWAAEEVSRACGDETYARACRSILRDLAMDLASPHETDVMFGNAGAIPALLDLASRGFEEARALAIALGDDLVRSATREPNGLSWTSGFARRKRMPNYLGFSHGVAGIGWALARLYRETGGTKYAETASGAFEYERAHYYDDLGNWPHFSEKPGPDGRYGCSTAWCHGAPGIGVSRALSYPLLKDRRMKREMRVARDSTRADLAKRFEFSGLEVTACHGITGTVECLAMIEEAIGGPAWSDARAVADYLLDRYGPYARKRWGEGIEYPTGAAAGMPPGLLTGGAGIAHFYLRCHDPARVPTLLVPGCTMT